MVNVTSPLSALLATDEPTKAKSAISAVRMAGEIFMGRLSQNCLRSWWPKENDPHLQILADRLWRQDVVHFLSTRPLLASITSISLPLRHPLCRQAHARDNAGSG